MRICVVYDCLFPLTVGGAERWYRNLAERLASGGHEVSYLTLRQWDRGERAQIDPRVRVVTAGPRMALTTGLEQLIRLVTISRASFHCRVRALKSSMFSRIIEPIWHPGAVSVMMMFTAVPSTSTP